MAEWAERDERWIVQDMGETGRNVNSWHWEEKNCLGWLQERVATSVCGIPAEVSPMVGTVQIDRLVSLTGHASVSTRKGNKKVCLYDLTVTLAWSGTPPDTGDDVSKGEVTLKEFATENDEDEYLWEGKADTKGPGADEMLKGVLSLRAVVVQRLLEAVELMKDVYSHVPPTPSPATAVRQWVDASDEPPCSPPRGPGAPPDVYAECHSVQGRHLYPWSPQTPTRPGRLRVLTYNVLGEILAHMHENLYVSVPRPALMWPQRWQRIRHEMMHLAPDIICCQEIENAEEALRDMSELGYAGRYVRRGGGRGDGCATFWRAAALTCVEQRAISFEALDMRDNTALVVVLRDTRSDKATTEVVVGNTHVLFNPNRGDVKMGQVRILMDLVAQMRAERNYPPAVIAGDFNSSPGSRVHSFAKTGQVSVGDLGRKYLSGQTVSGGGWTQHLARTLGPLYHFLLRSPTRVPPPPPPPPPPPRDHEKGEYENQSDLPITSLSSPPVSALSWEDVMSVGWSEETLRLACGDAGSRVGSGMGTAQHGLRGELRSSYETVLGEEPLYTTAHSNWVGCVDYLWYTPGGQGRGEVLPGPEAREVHAKRCGAAPITGEGGGVDDGDEAEDIDPALTIPLTRHANGLSPRRVLLPPALESLGCGLPNDMWGSDHTSLCCEYELVWGEQK